MPGNEATLRCNCTAVIALVQRGGSKIALVRLIGTNTRVATLVFEFDAVRWLLRLFLGPKTSLLILAFEEVSEKEDQLEERIKE